MNKKKAGKGKGGKGGEKPKRSTPPHKEVCMYQCWPHGLLIDCERLADCVQCQSW